jgi:hypothetical protein
MRFRIAGLLLVSFIILILGCTPKPWLPNSDEKKQNLEDEVCKQITGLAENDHYFPDSFRVINSYVHAVMNSLNQNNGQTIMIANDGMRYVKFTFVLDKNENIDKMTVQRYSKDLVAMFKKYKICQDCWDNMIHEFNQKGYGFAKAGGEYFKLSYDFEEDSFLITREFGPPSVSDSSWRMSTIRRR